MNGEVSWLCSAVTVPSMEVDIVPGENGASAGYFVAFLVAHWFPWFM